MPASVSAPEKPHFTFNGHLTTFKAVVPGAGLTADYYYRWDIDEANKYSIHSLTLRKPDGALSANIPTDTDFDVCTTLARNAEAGGEVLFVALYDSNGRMLNLYLDTEFLTGTVLNSPATYTRRISQISGRQIAAVKVFILSGTSGIMPAANVGF